MLIIETNFSCDNQWNIKNHQSRIIEINSWEEYIEMYEYNNPEYLRGTMDGYPFFINYKMTDLKYDDKHLSCKFSNGTMKFAYKVDAIGCQSFNTIEFENGSKITTIDSEEVVRGISSKDALIINED